MEQDDSWQGQAEQAAGEVKKYLSLQQLLFKIESVEKLSVLLALLITIIIAIILGTSALFYLSLAAAYWLSPLLGSFALSLCLIGVFYICIIVAILLFRKQLIVNPLVCFLSKLFLNHDPS